MPGYPGKQGRKPKASTIVDRQREQGWEEPQERRLPNVPPHLTKVAKAEWRRMGRLLRDAGLLTALDITALELYCIAYAGHMEAEAMLQGPVGCCPNCDPRIVWDETPTCRRPYHILPEFGTVIRNRKGVVSQSPYVAIAKQAMAQMIRLLGEFGMTPASRSRIPKNQDRARGPRPAPAASQPTEPPIDPREALNMSIQASKN